MAKDRFKSRCDFDKSRESGIQSVRDAYYDSKCDSTRIGRYYSTANAPKQKTSYDFFSANMRNIKKHWYRLSEGEKTLVQRVVESLELWEDYYRDIQIISVKYWTMPH